MSEVSLYLSHLTIKIYKKGSCGTIATWFQLKMNQSVSQKRSDICQTHLLNSENTPKDYLT